MTAPTPVPGSAYPTSKSALQRIDRAAEDLAGVAELPLAEAAALFDALHGELQTALADLDQS